MELLLGCGNSRLKRIRPGWCPEGWTKLVTLDMDPNCGASIIAHIEDGLPFADEVFDEIHVYDTLEHFGAQGDFRAFFRDFGEMDRVLKPYGVICGITPRWGGVWAWSDPGHTRVITPSSLAFLNQEAYKDQCGTTAMTDYRWLWKRDLRLVWAEDKDDSHLWVLQKHPATV